MVSNEGSIVLYLPIILGKALVASDYVSEESLIIFVIMLEVFYHTL